LTELRRLVRQELASIVSKPLNLVLAGALAMVLGFGAAPPLSGDPTVAFVLSGRLFFLVSGMAAILGYAFAHPRRRVTKDAAQVPDSARRLASARILASTILGTAFAWLSALTTIVVTGIRFRAWILPVRAMGFYVVVGAILLAAAFAGATILAGFTASRVVKTCVRWGLFFPGIVALFLFRAGAASTITPSLLTYVLLIAALICAVEAFFLLQLISDRSIRSS